MTIGTGKSSFFVSVGKDSEAAPQEGDRQDAAEASAVPPMQLNVSLLPILKFYSSVDDGPLGRRLVATLEQEGNDKLIITSTAGPRGATTPIKSRKDWSA